MNWRAAALAPLLLLILACLLLACSKGTAPGRAGVRITLEADFSTTPDVDVEAAMKSLAHIIERRLDAYGASATVQLGESNRLSVELRGIDPEVARTLVGRTAVLEFREAKVDENGDILFCRGGTVIYDPPGCDGGKEVRTPPDSLSTQTEESVIWVPAMANGSAGQEVALTSRFLKPNTFVSTNSVGLPILSFEMTAEGAPLLEQVTTRLIGLPLAFFLDGEPIQGEDGHILAPTVRAVISDKGIIQGFSAEDARMLSIQLNSGALPVPLKVVQVEDLAE